ncbi:MAG: hypothetical protein FVQ79_14380, partial [Planctomycetes bacterium]|nr:hypothetical protein [Planctomycetota bacterium]
MTELMTIHARLEAAAYKVTDNFCYSCYKVVEGDQCPQCWSDDFMRHLSGVGVEYGCEWVIEHLIKQHCTAVDGEELYEEILDECYPEIAIGCCTFSPSDVMKELDPTCFRVGAQENLDSLTEDCQLYESEGEYYQMFDIEEMLDS